MSANLEVRRNVLPMRPVAPMGGGMFDIPGVTFTPTGIVFKRGLPIQDWVRVGLALRMAGNTVRIGVGDWIRFGKHEYGRKYQEALALTGYKEGTLRDSVWVANKVPLSLRGDNLKFQHYKIAAKLPTKGKIRKWLTLADDKHWSAARLSREIDKSKRPPAPADTAPLTKLHEKIVREELDAKRLEVKLWQETSVDPLLSDVYRRIVAILEWQRDRTERGDCEAIMQIFTGDEGTEGTERATDGDIPAWLYGHGFIMTKEEIGQGGCPSRCTIEHAHLEKSGRLGLMVRLKMLSVETREGSRHKDQPGVITSVYKPEYDYLSFLVDDVPELDAAEREPALLKDWTDRLKRYAPELLPKKEQEVPPMK